MRLFYVPLSQDAINGVVELAGREMRQPRAQAAWLILDGLKRAGLLETGPREAEQPAEDDCVSAAS